MLGCYGHIYTYSPTRWESYLHILHGQEFSNTFSISFFLTDHLRSETEFLEEMVFGSGDTVEIHCNVPDSSTSLFWYKDGIGISPTNRTHIGQKLLRIINVSYEDSGVYSCKPRHSIEMFSNFTVRVAGECGDKIILLSVHLHKFATRV